MGSDISPLSKELDKTAEQIAGEMRRHYRSCDKAEAVVKAIEIEQRVTKEMTNPEFFKHAEKRIKEKKKKKWKRLQKRNQSHAAENNKSENWLVSCDPWSSFTGGCGRLAGISYPSL
jgi:23S rRNA A1618 N6-methylase RlmF